MEILLIRLAAKILRAKSKGQKGAPQDQESCHGKISLAEEQF